MVNGTSINKRLSLTDIMETDKVKEIRKRLRILRSRNSSTGRSIILLLLFCPFAIFATIVYLTEQGNWLYYFIMINNVINIDIEMYQVGLIGCQLTPQVLAVCTIIEYFNIFF